MGSNVSRDPLKECIERRPWKPLRKLSKDPQTDCRHSRTCHSNTARNSQWHNVYPTLKLATVIHINLTTI